MVYRVINLFFDLRFDKTPLTRQCETEDKKDEEFQISLFYWSFSSDTVAVKGLIFPKTTRRFVKLL